MYSGGGAFLRDRTRRFGGGYVFETFFFLPFEVARRGVFQFFDPHHHLAPVLHSREETHILVHGQRLFFYIFTDLADLGG